MNFKINKNLDKNKLREQWNDEKVLAISPFLEESCANELIEFLNKIADVGWTQQTNIHDATTSGSKQGKRILHENLNEMEIQDLVINMNKQMGMGLYSQMYEVSKLHDDTCDCTSCKYSIFLNSNEVKSFLAYITGEKINRLSYNGYSRYLPNSFLGIHNDTGNGELVGILGLTKDWKPEDGGHLCYTTHDRKKITKIIQSDFNQFVLHYVPPKIGIPHFVSQVAPWANKPRVSHVCCYFTE